MDILLGLTLMVGVIIFGGILLYKTINDRFPKVNFDVRDRGTLINQNYREFGKLIVKDDLIGILLGNYRIYGISGMYEFVRTKGGKVYQAVLRHDFLFAIEHKEKNSVELEQTKPLFILPKEMAYQMIGKDMKFMWEPKLTLGEYMLVPLKAQYTNELLTERAVSTPKEIASRLIEQIKNNKMFNDASNPVMAVLISALPLGIVVLLTCILVYVVMMGFNSSAVEMLKTSQEIITLLKSRGA